MASKTADQSDRVPRTGVPGELLVRRSDPVYNGHSYLTKVPVSAVMPFIDAFTDPGDTVMDPFAGSGMTGVAAAMLGRRAILSDISVLGQHVGRNYTNLVDRDAFLHASDLAIAATTARLCEEPYRARCRSCHREARLIRTVWTVELQCPGCADRINFYGALEASGWSKRDLSCPRCETPISTRDAKRIGEAPVVETILCLCSANQLHQPPSIETGLSPGSCGLDYPRVSVGPDREMFSRSALAKHGLTEVASFFSPRNLAVLAALRQAIEQQRDRDLSEKLRFAFTAILARASKRYQWSRQRPLNASNQTYYIAPVFYEWNVLDLFSRKAQAIARSDAFIRAEIKRHCAPPPDVRYERASATDLGEFVADSSVDYVFTDPPFGSNIFYSDMNLFAEAWLDAQTDVTQEAVVHTTKQKRAKAAARYEQLLRDAFAECRRALKPDGWLTVVFSSTDGRMWALLARALRAAGFAIEHGHITLLDKGQRSVKGLASGVEGVVTCDVVLSMPKQELDEMPEPLAPSQPLGETLMEVLKAEDESLLVNVSRFYVSTVRAYLRNGWRLDELSFARVVDELELLGFHREAKSGRFTRAEQLELAS